MELPIYCLYGDRPVVAVRTADGGLDVLVYDWKSGELVRDMTYLSRIFSSDTDVEYVTEATFEQALKRLRSRTPPNERE